MNDLIYAWRRLRQSPGFALVAIVTLALGIGANTAIFGVVDRLLVRPLPVQNPDSLALIGATRPDGADFEFNFPLIQDYQRANTVFADLSATATTTVGLGTDTTTGRHQALLVSGNYFRLLGVPAALGRTFAENEGVEVEDAAVVVLGHGVWVRQFGADPAVIGRSIRLNGHSFTVIGVAPREFRGTTRSFVPDLYVPITAYGWLDAERPGNEHPLRSRYFTWVQMFGRLREGVSREQAQESLNLLARGIHAATPANTSTNLVVLPGAQGFTQDFREVRLPLRLLWATAALVLLIACANLANLQLARAQSRSREVAIRLALGARRTRIVRQLLTESLMLSLAGGVAGVLVALWLGQFLERFRPPESSVSVNGDVDFRLLGFALLASLVTGVGFGLFPALRASRPNVVPELKGGTSGGDGPARRGSMRQVLVVFQVALSLLVLIGAGLCVRSLLNLRRVDPGFEPSQVLLVSLDLGLNRYDPLPAESFYANLLERVRTLPGVESAGLASTTPLSGRAPAMSVERVEGYEPPDRRGRPFGDFTLVTPGYFGTMGIPLLQGRDVGEADTALARPVVVVNEAFARRYWPGQEVLGRRIFQHSSGTPLETEVVGVVRTTKHRRLTDDARPAMYFPVAQKPDQARALTLAVRTGLDPTVMAARLREVVKALDPQVPVFSVRTMEQQRDGSLALERMAATLLLAFGGLALLLAALGIYGVLAYSVGRRTREIGVRMALGARVTDVLTLVLRQGLSLVGIGLGVGLLAALGATRWLGSFLFGVSPLDPLTLGLGVLLLALVALAACWLPARRAARVNPIVALRQD